ncbi:L-histidine N(alpha)-methyltransferase [Anthocerotibacter panamensis]|uniref:L-histidine N(alpha)-methyltransferase n=1 Tax=Anthocerotibacter panamensis TaxID=2857077 RepID=UPI001C404EC5|nr:L-histidine N(alpha)-methyltransferase [Anthocerotibacter panamensis]
MSSTLPETQRLQVQDLHVINTYAQDIRLGLTSIPKFLQPKYFYDATGSRLFEAICGLPEYYPTRTETSILERVAREIFQKTGPCDLLELGSGSSTKTTLLLDALDQLNYPMVYLPVDVSRTMLISSAQQLSRRYPRLRIHALVADYEQVWTQLPPAELSNRMVVFLGSTLGNFSALECERFLGKIAGALQSGDYFLLGVDLRKPVPILEAAYDDRQGVTAAFNLNLLQRLNRDFDGNFDLEQFEHWAFYNPKLHQIEMHLRSRIAQTVTLPSLELEVAFATGETIHTESSRKFDREGLESLLTSLGLTPLQSWQDPQNWFSLILCTRV